MNIAALRESMELEKLADLHAMSGWFGEASRLMREVNIIRRREFGPHDPNELRELAASAMSTQRAETQSGSGLQPASAVDAEGSETPKGPRR